MPIVYSLADAEVPDRDRRISLFSGDVFVYSPRESTLKLCSLSRNAIEQMLGADPIWAQQRMSENEFAVLFTRVARTFGHMVTDLASSIVADFGCDPDATYIGLPSLAATTGRGFIAHGLGIPQHPHRDTWFGASPCQLNWWVPLYDLDASSTFAFHPLYWELPVVNTSGDFSYEEWYDASRRGESMVPAGMLAQPRCVKPIELTPDLRIRCPAGSVILSSAAQLYSTVPNESLKTHFSVHFQTVSEVDLENGSGAYNVDARAEGTSLSRFIKCSDSSPIPMELIERDLERRRSGGGRQVSG